MGKELDDPTLQNLLLRMLPVKWERQMRFQLHTQKSDVDYSGSRQELLDLAINVSDEMGPSLHASSLANCGERSVVGSQAWLESLPSDLRGRG